MHCQHCRRELADGEAVYRLSLHCGHPWAARQVMFGRIPLSVDQVVQYVCGGCCDPAKESWIIRQWRLPMSCKSCGRPVIHDTVRKVPAHVVCGPECRMAVYAKQARLRRQRPMRNCPICGKPFQPKRTDAQFCSHACRQRAHRQRHKVSAVTDADTVGVRPETVRNVFQNRKASDSGNPSVAEPKPPKRDKLAQYLWPTIPRHDPKP